MRGVEKVVSQPNAIDAFIGHRIQLRRKVLGMGEETLAAALGVTAAQVRRYEQGMRRVCAVHLLTAAEALQVHFSWFFEEASSAGGGLPKTVAELDRSKSTVFPSETPRRRRGVLPTLWGGRTLGLSAG
jgi:transcriptional regulator with XRE-family HTH domain